MLSCRALGFDAHIGFKLHQFGNNSTLFFVTFVLCETPWVLTVKRFGPDKALGTALVVWSAVTLATDFI